MYLLCLVLGSSRIYNQTGWCRMFRRREEIFMSGQVEHGIEGG